MSTAPIAAAVGFSTWPRSPHGNLDVVHGEGESRSDPRSLSSWNVPTPLNDIPCDEPPLRSHRFPGRPEMLLVAVVIVDLDQLLDRMFDAVEPPDSGVGGILILSRE
jgi:hypothetical protein